MVKTLLRPHCLEPLLKSLRKFYPDEPVIVTDDSPEPYPEVAEPYDVHYETFDYDIGIGTCYNWTIDHAETPYIVLLDDDFVFTEQTRIDRFLPFLEAGVCDLVGGEVWNSRRGINQSFCGFFTQGAKPGKVLGWEDTKSLQKIPRNTVKGLAFVEITMNFFAARTDALREVRWDPRLKVCRHEDFFLRFNGYRPREPKVEGFRAAFYPGVTIDHRHQGNKPKQEAMSNAAAAALQRIHRLQDHGQVGDYDWHRRGRFDNFRELFVEKWNFEWT